MIKNKDKEFFIVYNEFNEVYDSVIGIDELAKVCKRTRANMLRSLKHEFIKIDNKKYFIISESDLNSD